MEANEAEGGLSTEEAFDRLLQELTAKLEAHYASVGKNWSEILRSSLSTRSRHTTITWGSLLILFVESIIIFILYSINYSHMWSKLLAEGIVMLFILFTNIGLVIWENYQRVNELPVKLSRIINQLKDVTSEISWEEKNYPDLFMPISPCISLQWCYRDGRLVNLPWALLVPGDVIVLQPAQKIIVECRLINDPDKILTLGEIYSPPRASEPRPSKKSDDASHQLPPRLHPPLPKCVAVVISSPYIEMVDISLKKFLSRPPSFYNKERHTVVARIIECILLPFAIMSFVALCLVRMFYLPHWLGIRVAPWADIILLQPMACTFPLIPVSLPFIWTLMQCIGNSRLWKGLQFWGFDKNFETDGMGEKVVLNRRRQQCRNIIDHWQRIRDFFLGRQETLHRSQKVLHVLASTTALCCVDKKGILSWPNPTADKLFFFRTVPAQPEEQIKSSQSSTKTGDNKPRRKSSCPLPSVPPTTIGEVLDITIDNNNELHFDDTQWENHMPNLKPLGLNILLNTCNHETREAYSSFHSHITHELFCNKNTTNSQGLVVPVTSRRCLCEVAKMIGFVDKATNAFSLEQELCSFRHIESDQVSRNKLTKAKIKFPFPHLMSIVVRERASQSLQLLTQGTGDIILDVCEDFWDGKDLRPMSDSERKLISDFYQRSSLSSICTAFAYKPISSTVSASIASLYMELPASKGLRYFPYNAAFPHLRDIDFNKTQDLLNLDEAQDSYISTDCLLADGNRNTNTEISDVQGYLQMQTGQIFLGMITMQYQACMDIVQLIEQLDQGCIRFVHFSKENELRSRVFSEKMGLESGWNCHISLSAKVEEVFDSSENTEQMDDTSNFKRNVTIREDNLSKCKTNRLDTKRSSYPKNSTTSPEEAALLPRCSASVPEMILLTRSGGNGDSMEDDTKTEENCMTGRPPVNGVACIDTPTFEFSSDEEETSTARVRFEDTSNLQVDQTNRNKLRSPSAMDSCSSAVLSPDSFQEVYEMVEHPTPLGFDMSNTAQLPVGIENIRPHLENVDNVPLLVSLFTDCNADNTCDMITIMQDYGEVTLLLGSVMNVENKELFVQADASVAIEPMYPTCCQKAAAFVEPTNGNPSPADIAMLLTSLPCSLSLKRKDCSILYDLIAQSRHFMNKCVRNSIQFWICCNVTVTVLGLLSLLMLLPPLYSLSDSIWLSCIIIPMLTIGLAFSIMSRVDISVMNSPSWKNQMVIDKQMIMYAFWCYGMKFIPSIINVSLMGAFNLRWICQQLPNATCSWVYPIISNQPSGEIKPAINPLIRPNQCISTWSCGNFSRLLYVQQFSMFFLVLYLVVISACFVYRSKYLWMRNPTANKVWVGTSISVLLVQVIYSLIKVGSTLTPGYDLLPAVSYVWGFVWAPIALAINELIRRHEIRVNIRYEKRARLDFGTKLGMNSPF